MHRTRFDMNLQLFIMLFTVFQVQCATIHNIAKLEKTIKDNPRDDIKRRDSIDILVEIGKKTTQLDDKIENFDSKLRDTPQQINEIVHITDEINLHFVTFYRIHLLDMMKILLEIDRPSSALDLRGVYLGTRKPISEPYFQNVAEYYSKNSDNPNYISGTAPLTQCQGKSMEKTEFNEDTLCSFLGIVDTHYVSIPTILYQGPRTNVQIGQLAPLHAGVKLLHQYLNKILTFVRKNVTYKNDLLDLYASMLKKITISSKERFLNPDLDFIDCLDSIHYLLDSILYHVIKIVDIKYDHECTIESKSPFDLIITGTSNKGKRNPISDKGDVNECYSM